MQRTRTLIFDSPMSREITIYGVSGGRGGLGREGRIINCRVLERIMVHERRKEWKECGQGRAGHGGREGERMRESEESEKGKREGKE